MQIPKDNSKLEKAKALRRDMTPHERKLWYLFLRHYPVKIYKQRIIGPFIADFYCASAKLVIEIDGSQHYDDDGAAYDAERTAYLGQHRAIVSASRSRLFAPLLQFEKREIHTVFLRFPNFELSQKSGLGLLAKLCGVALESYGLKVIRYSNREIDREFPVVCQQIDSIIRERRS